MPRQKTKEELKDEVCLDDAWRTPGPVNSYFKKPPIPRAKVLDTWTAARVDQPVRNYEKYFISKNF